MEQKPEPTIVNVIGAPASGKGTLCKRLAADHGFGHVSIGDTLRALLSSPNTDPEIIEKVKNAELLPIEALGPILKAGIDAEKQTGSKVILLDGFPRQLDQAAPVEAQIGSLAVVLFFDCPEDLALQRFLTRKLDGRETEAVFSIDLIRSDYNQLIPFFKAINLSRSWARLIDTLG